MRRLGLNSSAPIFDSSSIEVSRTQTSGNERKVRPELLLRILGGALNATKNGAEWDLKNESGRVVASLKEAAGGYGLKSGLHPSIQVKQLGGNTTEKCRLATWINRNELFRIVFSQPEYFYSNGQLYHRTGFDSDVALVRRVITARHELNLADSEKGKPEPNTATDMQFPAKSIFRIVEDSLLQNSDYLWCSDLGDEWADYISLNNDAIIFAHCKHGKKTTLGATPYQVVVGQAMKNLGNVKSTPSEFTKKIETAGKKPTWKSTGIQKLRTPSKTWANFKTDFEKKIGNPNFAREVHLVITMLSVVEFQAEAKKTKKKASFVQLVWLLSSFINSCLEMGATPKIICKD